MNDVPVFHSVTKNSAIAGSRARQHTFSEQELSDVKMLKGCHQVDSVFHVIVAFFTLSASLCDSSEIRKQSISSTESLPQNFTK